MHAYRLVGASMAVRKSNRGHEIRTSFVHCAMMLRSSCQDDDEDITDDEDTDEELERYHVEELFRFDNAECDMYANIDLLAAKGAPHIISTAVPVRYHIAIPTHGRWQPSCQLTGKQHLQNEMQPFILTHTLHFLACQGVPTNFVTLFVASTSEMANYSQALQGTDWENVRIVVSAFGNRENRNFIFKYFPSGTYVVSIDDDMEGIAWKCREGMKHAECLRPLPAGGLERIIFDAHQQMLDNCAFLWGLNTSQNPRHMRTHGLSMKNGLVCGYLNGFICRPECPELLRQLTDATEDSEFAVRHFAKDGVVLRYRMYCGITRPYLNRGGLQSKFEATGEQITAKERSSHRKTEERHGAAELHKLFPRLIGPPQRRRDKKTMEVVFYPNGIPPAEACLRNMIAPRYRGQDMIIYKNRNPKKVGSKSYELYEAYKCARTVAEARSRGARGIDFAFDSNWGYLTVTGLDTHPLSRECEVHDRDIPVLHSGVSMPVVANGIGDTVKVRLKEMSGGHGGLAISRVTLVKLAMKCKSLRELHDAKFAATSGPFVSIRTELFRILLYWADAGRLLFARNQDQELYLALKACGAMEAARKVKQVGALKNQGSTSKAPSKARKVAVHPRARDCRWAGPRKNMGTSRKK